MGRVVTDLCFFKKKGNNNFEGKHLRKAFVNDRW